MLGNGIVGIVALQSIPVLSRPVPPGPVGLPPIFGSVASLLAVETRYGVCQIPDPATPWLGDTWLAVSSATVFCSPGRLISNLSKEHILKLSCLKCH